MDNSTTASIPRQLWTPKSRISIPVEEHFSTTNSSLHKLNTTTHVGLKLEPQTSVEVTTKRERKVLVNPYQLVYKKCGSSAASQHTLKVLAIV